MLFSGPETKTLSALSATSTSAAPATTCRDVRHEDFIVPNESYPYDASPLIAHRPNGPALVVGGERAFFDSLMMREQVDRKIDQTVYAVDMDPQIISFINLNNLLLKISAAAGRDAYPRLRLHPNNDDWEQAAAKAEREKVISHVERVDFLARFSWWEKTAARPEWRWFARPPMAPSDPFYGVNYLHNHGQLSLLQQSAKREIIVPTLADLREPRDVATLLERVKASGARLSLVDLSNAWDGEFPNDYMGIMRTAALLAELNNVVTDETLLLVTQRASTKDHFPTRVYYHAYTFSAYRRVAGGVSSWSGKPLTGEDFMQRVAWNFRQHHADMPETGSPLAQKLGHGAFFGNRLDWSPELAASKTSLATRPSEGVAIGRPH